MRWLTVACLFLSACATRAPEAPVDLVISSATVIDVRNGVAIQDRDVVVDKGKILSVPASGEGVRREATTRIDGRGFYVIPGLWDNHVHFGGGLELVQENKDLLPLYVAHGITTVRDAAGDLSGEVLQWRAEVASGKLLGPTIYTSGPKIEGIDSIWPGDLEVGTETELTQALDRLQAMHVDFVKITDNTLKPELFLSALRQAQQRGLRTSAHLPMSVTVEDAADAGLDSIEHIGYAIKAGSREEARISREYREGKLDYARANEQLVASFDMERAKDAYRRLAEKGVSIDPTLNGSQVTAYLDQDDHKSDDYLKYIGPGLQKTYEWRVQRAAKDDADTIRQRHARFEQSAGLLPVLRDAGVPIIIGTDAGFLNSFNYPGVGLHQEMALYVRYGMTRAETLRAATLGNATFLGKQGESGEVAAGMRADLVLLRGNPLQDIATTRQIEGVVLQGRYLDRNALDRLLRQVEDAAKH